MATPALARPLVSERPTEVARRALAEARAALGMDVAWLGEVVGDRLVLGVIDGDEERLGRSEGDAVALDAIPCARVARAREACWLTDVQADLGLADTGLGAYVGVPVRRADGGLYGTLACASYRAAPHLDDRDAALLAALAGVVAGQLEHEHRYRQVLETAAEPVWVTDLRGITIFANEPTARLLGCERGELAGRSAYGFLAPQEHERVAAQLAERGEGRMSRYETVLLRADGATVPVEVEGAPLAGPQGEVIGTVATLTDLTARKDAERLSEERFRWLAELVDHQIWIAGPDRVLHFTNGRIADYFGPETAGWRTTSGLLRAVHPDDAARAAEQTARAWAAGRPCAYEARLRRHDGAYVEHLVQAFPVRDDAGAVARWYGVSTDLTEVRAQEELLRSEASLREAQQLAQLGSFERELPGGTMALSAEMRRILDLRPGDGEAPAGAPGELGRLTLSRVHPEDRERVLAVVADAEAGCGSFALDHRLRLPEGGDRVVHTRGTFSPGPGPGGTPVRLRGTVQDVTEQRTAEVAARGRAEAERANRAKSEFLSRMSHELRTPLNAILGFGQLLELEPLDADQRESVGHILKGGAHLLELINEVLEISRIEAGALRLSLEAVELGQAVRDVVALVAPLAVERGVAVRTDADGDTWVRADVGRLKQIVLNLLSNAIKYNRPGGLVTVRIRPGAGGGIRLVVSDTGPGLRPDELERVFSPFERLSADGSTEGTGLGLTLSRSLAEALGGRLTASSEPGCGADFTLALVPAPAPDPHGTEASPAGAPTAAVAGGRRVLYVEDNPSNLRLVERVLSRAGVQVMGAPQGRLGLELARRHLPDLVLLDLDLPDGPGELVLAGLAQDPATAGIPVVVCSADASAPTIERLLAAGAREYLAKPLDVGRLLKTVAEATDGGSG